MFLKVFLAPNRLPGYFAGVFSPDLWLDQDGAHDDELPHLLPSFSSCSSTRVYGRNIKVPPPLSLTPNPLGPGPITHHTVGVAPWGLCLCFSL